MAVRQWEGGYSDAIRSDFFLQEFLTDSGGDKNSARDFSLTPETFDVEVPAGQEWAMERLRIGLAWDGAAGFGDYGPITGGMTNGYTIEVIQALGGASINLVGSQVFDWFDLVMLTTETGGVTQGSGGNTESAYAAAFDFSESTGPLLLRSGDKVSVTLNDDLSGFTEHQFKITARRRK